MRAAGGLLLRIGGLPDNVVLRRIGVLEFASTDAGTVSSNNLFETDQSAVRAIEHFDIGWRHENSWGIIDTIDKDLPAGVI